MSCKDVLAILTGLLTNLFFVFVLDGQHKTVMSPLTGKEEVKIRKLNVHRCDISLDIWAELLMSCWFFFCSVLRGTRHYCVHLGSCILMSALVCYCQDIKCPFFHWHRPQILPIGHAPIWALSSCRTEKPFQCKSACSYISWGSPSPHRNDPVIMAVKSGYEIFFEMAILTIECWRGYRATVAGCLWTLPGHVEAEEPQ